MTRWAPIVFFLMSAPALCADMLVSEEICNQFLLEHEPDADVSYSPDSDSDMGLPVDLGGSIKIVPPKTIHIPIKLDVSKYLRVPEKQAALNQQLLNQSSQSLQAINGALAQESQTISTSQTGVQNANQVIEQELTTPIVNIPLLQNTFSQAAVDYQIAVNSLVQIPPQIQQVTGELNKRYEVLQKQFNPYETDAIKEQNLVLKAETQQALANNINLLVSSVQQAAVLSENIKTTIDLLEKSPNTFANKDQFQAQLESLQSQLNQTKSSYDGLSISEQKKMTDLNQKIAVLNDNQNRYIEEAELGSVEMHQDGRIYFNGQPLFREDELALKQACREVQKK